VREGGETSLWCINFYRAEKEKGQERAICKAKKERGMIENGNEKTFCSL
jgi:hypothetical protein